MEESPINKAAQVPDPLDSLERYKDKHEQSFRNDFIFKRVIDVNDYIRRFIDPLIGRMETKNGGWLQETKAYLHEKYTNDKEWGGS